MFLVNWLKGADLKILVHRHKLEAQDAAALLMARHWATAIATLITITMTTILLKGI